MIKMELLLGVVGFALMVYCLIEAISTSESNIRNLPKIVWILLILFFPLVGSVAWLVAGRPENGGRLTREQGGSPGFPEYERRGRMAAGDAEKDEEFLPTCASVRSSSASVTRPTRSGSSRRARSPSSAPG